jgi:hypothetical protein
MIFVPKTLYAEITLLECFKIYYMYHLAPVANNIFLNTLQGGIEHFISGLGNV